MRDEIMRALARSRADFTDIRMERTHSTSIRFSGKVLEELGSSVDQGGIVRCLVGGGWGVAVFNSPEQLMQRVEDAERIARVANAETNEKVQLAPVPPVQDEVRVALKKDPRQVPLSEKKALIQRYNDMMLGEDKRIVNTATRYTDSFSEITLANSEGTWIVEERPDITLALISMARSGEGNIQVARESIGEATGYELVENREEDALKSARRALALLDAEPVKGGIYTVILDQLLTGVFIHEAFGHLCEADFLSKSARLREILSPGRTVGVPNLTVVEDGYIPGRRGNFKYDDEGTLRQRTYLIKGGVLQGFLHSRETAARMGAAPTGNARAISFRFPPIVRMRNTFIDKGTVPFQEMIREIPHGIYACSAVGGNTMLEQFTFSAAYGYEIIDGQVGPMLRDIVLTGNIFETLKNIDCIGDDLAMHGGAGGCGKGGQFPLGVTDGGPHIRIQNLTVGGR